MDVLRACGSRSSLSPSHFDEAAVEKFKRTNLVADSESDMMIFVILTMRGNTGIGVQQAVQQPGQVGSQHR